jgi:hypothetical protein
MMRAVRIEKIALGYTIPQKYVFDRHYQVQAGGWFDVTMFLLIGQFWRKTGRLRPIQRRFYAILLAMSIT